MIGTRPDASPSPPLRWSLPFSWLFVPVAALLVFFAVRSQWEPNTFLRGDGSFYVNISRTLLEGRLDQRGTHPSSWYEMDLGWNKDLGDEFSNVSLGRNGQWFPKHNVLMPLAAAPFWAIGGPLGILAFNVLQLLVLAWLCARLAARFSGEWAALVAALAVLGTTYMLRYAYNFSNDLFYTTLIVGGLLAFFHERPALAGVLLGLSVWAKITNAPFLLPPALVLVARGQWRPLLRFLAGASVPLLCAAAMNAWCFGAPWVTSYQRVLVRKGGELTTASHAALFHKSAAEGLRQVLWGEASGVARNGLVVLLGLGGLAALFRRSPAAFAVVVFTIVSNIAIFIKYDFFEDRFIFPALAVGVVPLACLLGDFRQQGSRPVPVALRPPRARGVLAVLILGALVGGGWRCATQTPERERSLRDRMEDARVWNGDIPCDYWNLQRDIWECPAIEPRTETSFGRHRAWKPEFGEAGEVPVLWSPAPQGGKARTVIWDDVWLGDAFECVVGLADGSKPGKATVSLRVDGEIVTEVLLGEAGQLERRSIDTSAWSGSRHALELRVTSSTTGELRIGVNGRVEQAK